MIKQITFEDAMSKVHDESVNHEFKNLPGITGEVTLIDSTTGRVCFRERKNLIVLRGRTFALEKVFNDTIDNFGVNDGLVPYVSDLDRKVIAFGIGKGGAPASDPFASYAPAPTGPTGVQLAERIPFRLHDTSGVIDDNTFIPGNEIGNYGGAEMVEGHPTQFNYYLKHFDNADPAWMFNEEKNTVYKQITLSISAGDCRSATSNWINELALYFSRQDGFDVRGGAVFINPEMFSRITFPTEFLTENKALEIIYNIYA
jgi:hypothetical protein